MKLTYALEPFDVGRLLQAEIVLNTEKVTVQTDGPINPDSPKDHVYGSGCENLDRSICIHEYIRTAWWLMETVHVVQALIVSPTRELASQTERVILAIGNFISIQVHSCIGGKSIGEDIRKLEHGVHVVSGTPGRVCDMIKRRTLRTRAIKHLVLDETDEMLNRGFKDQIYDVYRYFPPEL